MTQDPTHSALHPGAETDVILVAAGRGERLGAESPKARVLLGGVPLFQHSLRLLCGHPGIARVFVVVPPDPGEMSTMDSLIGSAFEGTACPPLCVVPGGDERQDSVWLALNMLRDLDPPEERIVLVHDAARPLVSAELVSLCLDAMRRPVPRDSQQDLPGIAKSTWGGGPAGIVPALPIRETLKLVYETRIVLTQPREHLFSVQTPQVFRFGPLYRAHKRARQSGMRATDDAALLEWQGIPVYTVPGDPLNLKVTYAEDLALAEKLLQWRREREDLGSARRSGSRSDRGNAVGGEAS